MYKLTSNMKKVAAHQISNTVDIDFELTEVKLRKLKLNPQTLLSCEWIIHL